MSVTRSRPPARRAAGFAAALVALAALAAPPPAAGQGLTDKEKKDVADAVRAKIPDIQKELARGTSADPRTDAILKATRIDDVAVGEGNRLEFKGVCLFVEPDKEDTPAILAAALDGLVKDNDRTRVALVKEKGLNVGLAQLRTLKAKGLRPEDQPHVYLQNELAQKHDDVLLKSSFFD